jgi:FAD-dependent oxidoreductase domain-containing protein 1
LNGLETLTEGLKIMSEPTQFDVVIVGGGLYGCATAYFLLSREPNLSVCIVEPDPGYTHAASARSNAGVRVQFSQEQSIWMSQFGHEFYGSFHRLMAVDEEPATLAMHRRGYLLMATQAGQVGDMQANVEVQHSQDCNVVVHDATSLKQRFPGLTTDDVLMATESPDDMWIDPYGAVTGLLRKVRSMGATLVRERVVDFDVTGNTMTGVRLADGQRLSSDWVVNCAGAWAPELCRLLDISLPVQPLPIMAYYFETRNEVDHFGVTIDMGHASFRPEGKGFISIRHRPELLGSFCWEPIAGLFEEQNWPRLAYRVPAFESVKVMNSYCCHYAMNTFDGNALLGAWPGKPDNFLLVTGASGHGLQHAPACGRALSELVLDRQFSSIDLGRFGCERVVENRPDPERGFAA